MVNIQEITNDYVAEKEAACPKRGTVRLFHKPTGVIYQLPTSCKTWGCPVCSKTLLNYVKMRMTHGVLTHQPSFLTTVTFRFTGQSSLVSAGYAEKTWRKLLLTLKQSSPTIAWFKIPELTENDQIHLHLLMGGMYNKAIAACESPPDKARLRWVKRGCKESCLTHEISQNWFEFTNRSSYVCDVQPVRTPRGVASYLAKYLVKGFAKRDTLQARGYSRRYATSRNWGTARMRLRATIDGEWGKVHRINKDVHNSYALDAVNSSPPLIQVGTDLAQTLYQRNRTSSIKQKLRRSGLEIL